MNCISCNFEHNERYCPNCGEKSGTKKITLTSIFEDAFSSITHMDKGFLYNIKTLIINPKKITTAYLLGKRKGIINPVTFLILSITFYLIVITLFKVPKELIEEGIYTESRSYKVGVDVGYFIRENLKYFWILSIIPLGLSFKLIFKKYNYLEHLAVSSLIIGQATLIGIISYLIFRFTLIFDPFVYIMILWLTYKVFDNEYKIESFFLSMAALILFIIQLLVVIGVIGTIKYLN
jgi:hypothetical protein